MAKKTHQKVIVGKPREEIMYAQMYCDFCGRRITDYDRSGKCTNEGCRKVLCEKCVRIVDGKGYCPDHVPKKGCFIVSATYGTPLAPQLKSFRNFRDFCLMKRCVGRRICRFYYCTSPAIAKIVARSEELRKVIRSLLLIPLYFIRKKGY